MTPLGRTNTTTTTAAVFLWIEPQNPAQNSPISCDKVELLDNAGAGFPVGPLRVPRPANTVATGTLMDQAPFPNTFRLEVDADKIDPNGVLAVRVSFHASKDCLLGSGPNKSLHRRRETAMERARRICRSASDPERLWTSHIPRESRRQGSSDQLHRRYSYRRETAWLNGH